MDLRVDGRAVQCEPADHSLLAVLREQLGLTSVKDGCSPQGQCGCCTVLVDGSPRVACVTPARRVAGRSVTTVDGLDAEVRSGLVDAFLAAGASQCGFCTPGILVRLAGLGADPHPNRVATALLAHLCRCTGWNTIAEAASAAARASGDATARASGDATARASGDATVLPVRAADAVAATSASGPGRSRRDLDAASARATIEGGAAQRVGSEVVLGRAGFAADAPVPGMLIAVPDGSGGWSVGESVAEARAKVHAVPGRRSGQGIDHPVSVPDGDWALTLQTTWVEPAYLEPDVSWCLPGGEPASPAANGGAFGAKSHSPAPAAAAELARQLGRPVRVMLSREDVVRMGPKRPPVGAGIRADGTATLRVARTVGLADAVASVAPGFVVEEVDVTGPPTSAAIRGAGWVEAAVLLAAIRRSGRGVEVRSPAGALAWAEVDLDDSGAPGAVRIRVSCGDPLDAVVLRSYVIGAVHMAVGWVCSEAVATDPDGVPVDLTIRSFGILRARDMPTVTVDVDPSTSAPVNGSDAVFAAVAAATWVAQGLGPTWPTRRGITR